MTLCGCWITLSPFTVTVSATVNWAVMLLVERFSVTCMLDFVTLTQLVFTQQQMGGLVLALSPMQVQGPVI